MKFEVLDNFLRSNEIEYITHIVMNNLTWLSNGKGGWARDGDCNIAAWNSYLKMENEFENDYSKDLLSVFNGFFEVFGHPSQARVMWAERTVEKMLGDFHTDSLNKHKVGIFYLTTCNGTTDFDGVSIESKRNRFLLFDGDMRHRSTSNTDTNERIVIHFLWE